MCEQNASSLVKHSKLGAKNLNKICPKIVQKVLKWPLQYLNFQVEHVPRAFFILNMLQNNSAEKNYTCKYFKISALSRKNFGICRRYKNIFQFQIIYAFFGSNVL